MTLAVNPQAEEGYQRAVFEFFAHAAHPRTQIEVRAYTHTLPVNRWQNRGGRRGMQQRLASCIQIPACTAELGVVVG